MSPWNDDISTLPSQISSWLYSPDDEVNQSSRFDRDRRLFTIGSFAGNVPVGLAWQSRSRMKMDGFLYGVVDHHGEFTGDNITFIYPDFLTGLRGTFVNGVSQNATVVNVVAERCNNGVKELKIMPSKYDKDILWEKEEMFTTLARIIK